ncbi:SCO6880 family protein [Dactylosporangium sp. NPDC005572]|uniref:SCO6880 family protein n=1 Tax=Dactylosporangium sp. NPDC005572 TaxID=3156889 RepID=UPI00339FF310
MTQFTLPPRSTRGAVLGFSWGQIGTVVAGLIVAVVAVNLLAAGRPWSAAAGFVTAAMLFVLALVRVRGRRITEWLPVIAGALVQRAVGQDRYRGGVFASGGVEQHMDLPGPAAGYTWLPAVAADGVTQVGLLLHRRERTVTAALSCSGANFILADTDTRTLRLVDWARLLNILGTEYADQGLVRWSVTSRAVPDAGNRAVRFLQQRAIDHTCLAYRSLAEVTAAGSAMAQRHDIHLVVVFDLTRMSGQIAEAGGGDAAVAAAVLDKLPGIAASVAEAGVSVHGWLTPRRYAAVLRTQWDPAEQEIADVRTDGPAEVAPRLAGPVAAEAVGWDTYRHDAGYSRTLWVAEMPRQPVGATWLTPLYTRTTCRRTVTLTAQPVPAQLANLAARRDQVARAGDAVTKQKLRLVRTAREDEEARSVRQIDREQAHGHVRYRYALLVTVTAATVENLDRDTRAVKRILSRAGCDAIVLYGEQDQAFAAAALPLARGLKPIRGWAA